MSDSKNDSELLSGIENLGEITVPDPVQKGFLKAAYHLLGALTDIPVAFLEGFAADHRASTEARRELKIAAGRKLISQFGGGSDLANRALAQQISIILRKQVNVEEVLTKTAEHLGSEKNASETEAEVSEDWLENFRAEAQLKSEAEMQSAFARILAGEIQKPGTFSLRTVRALGQMDQETATMFQRFANACVAHPSLIDARVPSLGGNANTNALERYGLSFGSLNTLLENGLIISEFNSVFEYAPVSEAGLSLAYAGNLIILQPKNPEMSPVEVQGPALSKIGKELFLVTQPEENEQYSKELFLYLSNVGFSVGRSITSDITEFLRPQRSSAN